MRGFLALRSTEVVVELIVMNRIDRTPRDIPRKLRKKAIASMKKAVNEFKRQFKKEFPQFPVLNQVFINCSLLVSVPDDQVKAFRTQVAKKFNCHVEENKLIQVTSSDPYDPC